MVMSERENMRADFAYYEDDDTDIMEKLDNKELNHTSMTDDEEDEPRGISNDDYPSSFTAVHKALPLDNNPIRGFSIL